MHRARSSRPRSAGSGGTAAPCSSASIPRTPWSSAASTPARRGCSTRLDGSRDLPGLAVGAARLGVDADRLDELLAVLEPGRRARGRGGRPPVAGRAEPGRAGPARPRPGRGLAARRQRGRRRGPRAAPARGGPGRRRRPGGRLDRLAARVRRRGRGRGRGRRHHPGRRRRTGRRLAAGRRRPPPGRGRAGGPPGRAVGPATCCRAAASTPTSPCSRPAPAATRRCSDRLLRAGVPHLRRPGPRDHRRRRAARAARAGRPASAATTCTAATATRPGRASPPS